MQEFKIPYKEADGIENLHENDQQLVGKALAAMESAYAPYSQFKVGAAALLDNGTVVTGSNQENAAYPSGLCAERVALFYAGAQYPNNKVVKLAITAGKQGQLCNDPISPCGACRQVMLETEHRQKQPFEVILVGKDKIVTIEQARYLLPFAFDGDSLK